MEASWRILIADAYAKQHPAPVECGQMFFENLIWALARIIIYEQEQKLSNYTLNPDPTAQRFEVMCPGWISLLEAEPDHSPFSVETSEKMLSAAIAKKGHPEDYRQRYTQIETEIEETNGWRRPFPTANGLLGTGTKSLRVNDEVWILAGAEVPFILRPQ